MTAHQGAALSALAQLLQAALWQWPASGRDWGSQREAHGSALTALPDCPMSQSPAVSLPRRVTSPQAASAETAHSQALRKPVQAAFRAPTSATAPLPASVVL
jgi:hypothetical protein